MTLTPPREEARSRSEVRSDVTAVDGEAEKRSTVESSKPLQKGRTPESCVSETPSGLETEEPVKRRRKSRSKAAKKAAKSR